MEAFLRGLLRDLARQCDVIRTRLAANQSDPDVADHALGAYRVVETVRREVLALLDDRVSWVPELLPNYLRLYKRWHEVVDLVEKYPLPFIERYGPLDRRLTHLTRRLAEQVRWPLPPPLVAAFSHQYYWTIDAFNLIGAPATEGTSLLGLPDLCHELGHILLLHHEAILLGTFAQELLTYIEEERQQAAAGQRPPDYSALYGRLLAAWSEWWTREFAADMVATYLVGPAFVRQHVRLCAGVSQSAYLPTWDDMVTHPADDARMRAAVIVLRAVGDLTAADETTTLWSAYLTIGGESKPAEYDICYPESLLRSLATHVVAGCRALGIRSFDRPSDPPPTDIPNLLVDAWQRLDRDSEHYPEWERYALEALWRELGFDPDP